MRMRIVIMGSMTLHLLVGGAGMHMRLSPKAHFGLFHPSQEREVLIWDTHLVLPLSFALGSLSL